MAELGRFPSPMLSPSSSGKQQSTGRQRAISSCLTCRRRKVRCDHGHPACGACLRGNHVCIYASDQNSTHQPSPLLSSRVTKTSPPGATKPSRNIDVQSRLDRLETLLEQAVGAQKPENRSSTDALSDRQGGHEYESELTPSSGSGSSLGAGISSDGHDGTLLLEDGQSQFVSSLHWALLADEVSNYSPFSLQILSPPTSFMSGMLSGHRLFLLNLSKRTVHRLIFDLASAQVVVE